mgnify:CR=1 FL=1
MAGDWIPVFVDLPTKREVLAIASLTGRNRHEVAGRLVEFWIWAQAQSDGSVDALVDVHVDALEAALGPDLCFWQAVTRVGWLHDTPQGLVIPNAMRWLSRGAKARLNKTLRQNLWRQKPAPVDGPVDALVDAAPSTSPSTRERVRERVREEISLSVSEEQIQVGEVSKSQAEPGSESSRGATRPAITPNDLARGYNDCVSDAYRLPKVTVPLTPSRAKHAARRIREHPDVEWWNAVFGAYADSRFLRGEGGREGWRGACFDFLIANPENAVKVYEGAYADTPQAGRGG